MSPAVNPLIPATSDIVWAVIAVALLALTVAALVSIARSAKNLTTTQSVIWTLLAIFVPVIGPLAWLFIGRPASREPRERLRLGESS